MGEAADCEPWTSVARHKLQVEAALRDIADLDYVVLRPAMVYGLGDKAGLGAYVL